MISSLRVAEAGGSHSLPLPPWLLRGLPDAPVFGLDDAAGADVLRPRRDRGKLRIANFVPMSVHRTQGFRYSQTFIHCGFTKQKAIIRKK